jgi:hypothetical protein
MSMTWVNELSPGAVTGFGDGQADQGSGGVRSGVQNAVTASQGAAPLYSPDNPLFWFGAILLVAVGAITVSTSVDLGPLRGKARV